MFIIVPSYGQADEPKKTIKVGILLPLQSERFQSAAMAVEAGILAAQKIHTDSPLLLQFYPTTDQYQHTLQVYEAAAKNADYVIGPLLRQDVEALQRLDHIPTPTIALAMPSLDHDGVLTKPNMIMMGMSLEDEARQTAQWMENESVQGNVVVVTAGAAWQNRLAQAFQIQAKQFGLTVNIKKIEATLNGVNKAQLQQLIQTLQKHRPAAVLLALNLAEALQVKPKIAVDIPVWGTSALNPFMRDRPQTQRYQALNGVRLLDIPWQVNADNFKRYPPPDGYWRARPSSDQHRLYALGIDAYEIVNTLAFKQSHIDISGATGDLTANLGLGGVTYFQRKYVRAMYRNGQVMLYLDT